MNRFYNLNVQRKLMLAFSAVLALMVALGGYAIWQLERVNQTSTDMALTWMPGVQHAAALNSHLADFRVLELQHILSVDKEHMARYEKEMDAVLAAYKKSADAYGKLPHADEEARLWAQVQRDWDTYQAEHQKLLALSRNNQNEEALALVRGASEKQFVALGEALDKLVDRSVANGNAASRQGDQLYASARGWIVGAVLLALAVGLGLATWIARQISGALVAAVRVARAVASGDLTHQIRVRSRDEAGQLMQALKDMTDGLVGIVGQVRASSDSIATGASQIATGNADLSQRTEEQASNLQETAASMEELSGTVRSNADTSEQARRIAADAAGAVAQGSEKMGQVVSTMQDIAQASKKIAEINGVIDAIAFQTNILALNAAVEAARAGEQGRGFAVVASEVRTLAGRAAEAAREIKTLIGASVDKVEAGTQQVNDAGAAMQAMVGQVQRVSQMISEISHASQEQSTGIGQVGEAVAQLDQVTQQNAALVEESAAAAESLRQQAARLTEVVGTFKLAA